MFENNVISLKHSIMFYYKEYNNYLVNIHINEKTRFYNYNYFSSLKSIVLIINYINLKYNISPIMYDYLSLFRTNLLFFSYFSKNITFDHFNTNYDSYLLLLKSNYIYKYNYFYNLFLGYFHNEFNDFLMMEITQKNNNIYKNLKLNINKLSNITTISSFNDIKSNNALIGFYCHTNTSNHFFNKLLLSHTLFNI